MPTTAMKRTYYTFGKKTCCDNGMPWLQSETKPAKIFNLIFIILIFTLQNANARDTVYFQDGDPSSLYFVLWSVQFQPNKYGYMDVKIDSVLRGEYFINEKWIAPPWVMHKKYIEGTNIKMNTNYLVLTKVTRLTGGNILSAMEGDIFLNTSKNRKELSKKWDETIFIYKNKSIEFGEPDWQKWPTKNWSIMRDSNGVKIIGTPYSQ